MHPSESLGAAITVYLLIAPGRYVEQLTCDHHADTPDWFAECPQLPGCCSDGRTLDEAHANLDKARAEYLQSLKDDGLPVPPPLEYRS